MITVKADLHIHTLLSPCGDLEMTPQHIVDKAVELDLKIIGITDHNSTRQVEVVRRLASQKGIYVMQGAEITSREEVHCLGFFPDHERLASFQSYLDAHLPFIPNKDGVFGYQVAVDEQELILYMEEKLLITALTVTLGEIAAEVYRLGGIFIPAHVDRSVNSLFGQLGFIPPGLPFDAMGITCFTTENEVRRRFSLPENVTLIKNSDAHYVGDIGKGYTWFTLEECTFDEVRMALSGQNGRGVKPA